MATRFWVGGTGTWSSSNTTNWSATTGGAGGASVPTTADTVTFDGLSGTGTVTTDATTPNCGAITASSGGIILLQLGAALTSTGAFTLSSGTFNLQAYTLTCTTFSSNASAVRTIAFGTGNITVTSTGTVWNTLTTTNFTVTGTPVINVVYTGATAVTVAPGTSATSSGLLSFNFTGGTYPLTIIAGHYVNDLNFTGFAGSVANGIRRIYGNLTCSMGMTWTAGVSVTTFAANTGTRTITSNGKTLDFPITFLTSTSVTWVLQDALTIGSSRTTTLTSGTLDLNDKNFSTGVFDSSGATGRTLLMKSGTFSVTGASGTVWNVVSTNFTLTPATSKIALTGTVASQTRTFAGGGLTYNNLEIGGGHPSAATLTFTGNNTFNTISSTKTVAHTILFTAGTTTTVANWTVTGTVGNVVTIRSPTAASHNLVKTGGGDISVDYMNISWSNAT